MRPARFMSHRHLMDLICRGGCRRVYRYIKRLWRNLDAANGIKTLEVGRLIGGRVHLAAAASVTGLYVSNGYGVTDRGTG